MKVLLSKTKKNKKKLADYVIKNEISRLLFKYQLGNDVHTYKKQ